MCKIPSTPKVLDVIVYCEHIIVCSQKIILKEHNANNITPINIRKICRETGQSGAGSILRQTSCSTKATKTRDKKGKEWRINLMI